MLFSCFASLKILLRVVNVLDTRKIYNLNNLKCSWDASQGITISDYFKMLLLPMMVRPYQISGLKHDQRESYLRPSVIPFVVGKYCCCTVSELFHKFRGLVLFLYKHWTNEGYCAFTQWFRVGVSTLFHSVKSNHVKVPGSKQSFPTF